jgi:hypothetical protein
MWTLLLTLAAHASPLLLPPEEDAASWARAIQLAGLESGQSPPADGTWAALVHEGTSWRLDIHSATGTRTVPVTAPSSEAGREAVAVLAASLSRPVRDGPDLPALPAPPAAKPPSAPKSRAKPVPLPPVAEPARPTAEPVKVLRAGLFNRPDPEELDEAIDLREPSQAIVATPARWQPWIRGSGGMALRAGTAVAPSLSVAGGAQHGPLRAGLGAAFRPETALPALGPDKSLRSADGWIGAWVAPQASAGLGGLLGISNRAWIQSGERVAHGVMAFAGAEVTGRIPVGPIEISPIARLTFDFGETDNLIGDEPAADFAPVLVCFELAVAPRFDK